MRDYKFRGLKPATEFDGPKWIYGNLLNNCSIGEVGCNLDSYKYTEVDPETVGQFIRNDQYDTEIYEGDLFMNGDSIRIIEMNRGNTQAITPKRTESILLSFIIKSNPKNKVVGNIHQNPELLES